MGALELHAERSTRGTWTYLDSFALGKDYRDCEGGERSGQILIDPIRLGSVDLQQHSGKISAASRACV